MHRHLLLGLILVGCVDAAPPVSRIANVSIRASVLAGEQTLVVSAVVGGGAGSIPVLARVAGPALVPFHVADALPDPAFELHRLTPEDAVVAANNGWNGALPVSAVAADLGAFPFPPGSADAALLQDGLGQGSYSIVVRSRTGKTGIALAELYDASTPAGAAARFINVSARTMVGTGSNVLIAGFVISGSSPKEVLIRGIGPELARYGIAGYLANPTIALYQRNGAGDTLIARNDDWAGASSLSRAAAAVGAFPLTSSISKDAAMVVSLMPGTYTVQLAGAESTTGVALVEVYEIPSS